MIRRKIMPAPGERLLVCRTDRLGDLVLALPVVQTLKARFPNCAVDVLASEYAAPVLHSHPDIARVVAIDSDRLADDTYADVIKADLAARRYHAAIVLYPDKSVARLLAECDVPVRVGTAGRWHSFYFTHRLYHSRKKSMRHEAEYNLDLLKGFADGPTVFVPYLPVPPQELESVRSLLKKEIGLEPPYVILHPGSGGSADSWPVERFVELSDILITAGIPVAMTGSAEESEQFTARMHDRVHQPKLLAGKTDLRTLAGVLKVAAVVVANSTGPLHLAAAVGTRVVGLYPHKAVMSPRRWGPLGTGHRVVQPRDSTCHCERRPCQCMLQITARETADAVIATWRETETVRKQTS